MLNTRQDLQIILTLSKSEHTTACTTVLGSYSISHIRLQETEKGGRRKGERGRGGEREREGGREREREGGREGGREADRGAKKRERQRQRQRDTQTDRLRVR